jgi:Flp pilus assembly protein protease CpaA
MLTTTIVLTRSQQSPPRFSSPLVAAVAAWILLQPAGSALGTVTGFLLLVLLFGSSVTDISARRIHNSLTYPMLAAALLLNVLGSLLGDVPRLGTIGLVPSLTGALLCFCVMLFPYRMAGGGAGDVKLATVIGALLGPHLGLFAIALSYACAGLGILVAAAYRRGSIALFAALLRNCAARLLPAYVLQPSPEQCALIMQPVPLAPFFAAGTLLTVLEVIPR